MFICADKQFLTQFFNFQNLGKRYVGAMELLGPRESVILRHCLLRGLPYATRDRGRAGFLHFLLKIEFHAVIKSRCSIMP